MRTQVNKSIISTNILPHSIEAERSVIGSLMDIGSEKVYDAASPELDSSMFYDYRHGIIYDAVRSLREKNQPINVVSINNDIKKTGKSEDVPMSFLIDIMTNHPGDAHNAVQHALIIKQEYLRRESIIGAHEFIQQLHDPTRDIGEILYNYGKEIENYMLGLIGKDEVLSIKDVAKSSYDNINRKIALHASGRQTGTTTGFCDLDRMTSGWHGGELIIIGARPAMGKTAIALHFAKSAAKQGTPVVAFSLEMNSNSLFERLIASECNVIPDKIKTGNISPEELQEIDQASASLYNLPIHIDDNASVNMGYIRSVSRLLHRQGKCGMVVIDYLQLVAESGTGNRNREQEITKMSREAKIIAKELDIPVILLSQLNREVDKRTDKKPILADLRESGSIEQDADMVIFVHRPEYYGVEVQDNGRTVSNYGELIIAKHRNGQTGKVKFRHNGTLTKIFDYDTRGYTNIAPDNMPF